MGILGDVAWEPVDRPPSKDGLPTVTHEGIFRFGDYSLRCYRLDDGQTIINAEDIHKFFGMPPHPKGG